MALFFAFYTAYGAVLHPIAVAENEISAYGILSVRLNKYLLKFNDSADRFVLLDSW